MSRTLLAVAVAVIVSVPAVVLACDGAPHQASASPKKASVAEVATWTKEKKAIPVDANSTETRSSQGVIPGAVLLTSSSQYDVKELPTDKASHLVFYCASERCGASHQAAQKAMEAGYTDVAVMPEGIKGWRAAGQPVQKPNS